MCGLNIVPFNFYLRKVILVFTNEELYMYVAMFYTLSMWLINPGLTLLVAWAFEGATLDRFTGAGLSRGFWFSNLAYGVMIGAGIYGYLYDGGKLPIDDNVWKLFALIVAIVTCITVHTVDHQNYAKHPGATDESPSKWCNDIVANGIAVWFHLITWIPAVIYLPFNKVGWTIRGLIAFCLLFMLIGSIANPSKIDYVKIQPANYKELNRRAQPNKLRNFINCVIYRLD